MGRGSATAGVLTLGCWLCACQPVALEWTYEVDGTLAAPVAIVEARISTPYCLDGRILYDESFAPGALPTPPRLGAGRHGFSITLRDRDCLVIGRGCADVSLPSRAVNVEVTPTTPFSDCPVTHTCVEGRCIDPDADAGTDAGPDAPMSDAAVDVGPDAGAPDVPVDPCAGPSDGEPCPGGTCRAGSCCTGCWDGASCLAGDASDTCGAEGAVCEECVCADSCVSQQCAPRGAVTSLAVGDRHTCVVRDDALWCWGDGAAGQLGLGTVDQAPVPTRVGAGVWTQVSAGASHTCALDPAGVAHCFGANDLGQLGVGDLVPRNEPASTGAAFEAIDAGDGATCAIATGDVAYCWGNNADGQLGIDSGDAQRSSPAMLSSSFVVVAIGTRHACGVDAAGVASCWGDDSDLRLGQPGGPTRVPVPVDGDLRFDQVDPGFAHTVAVLREGGYAGWGDDRTRAMGLNAGRGGRGEDFMFPEPTLGYPEGAAVTQVATGRRHTCMVDATGLVQCTGSNEEGQSAGVAARPRYFDVPLPGRYVGVATRDTHTCALRDTGAIYCWGRNAEGQLGVGDTATREAPVRVCFE